jgi:hypothetical protein
MTDISVRPSLFSFSIDLPQPKLDGFNPLLLSELSFRIAEALQVPASSDSFRLRVGDALFGYDLLCTFFGGNVDVKKTAERLTLTFKNGRVQADIPFIFDRVARFLGAFASGHEQAVAIAGFCHGLSPSEEDRNAFLAQFAVTKAVTAPGVTGRVTVHDWIEPIKVMAEASFVLPAGLFVHWETTYRNLGQIKTMRPDHFKNVAYAIPASFVAAAAVFGLKIESWVS